MFQQKMKMHPENETKPQVNAAELERRSNLRMTMRVLLGIYLAYIIYQLIQGYLSGDSGLSFPLFITAVVFFVAAEVGILVFSIRSRKKLQEQIRRLQAQNNAAEKEGSKKT